MSVKATSNFWMSCNKSMPELLLVPIWVAFFALHMLFAVSPAQSQSWAGQVPVDVDKDTIVIGYLYDEALLDNDAPLIFFIPTDGSNAVTVNQLDSNFTYTVPEAYFFVPALAFNEMYVGFIGHVFDLVNNRPDGRTDEDFEIALFYGGDPIIESAFGKYIGEAAYSAADLTFVDFRDALARAIEASPENQTYITLMIPSVPILSDQVLLDAYVESTVLFAGDQFGLQPSDVGLLAELANIPTNYDPGIFTEPHFWLRAGRFRCLSRLALRVGCNVDGDDHGRPHLGSAILGKIVLCASIRRSERMTSPRPRAFSVFAMPFCSAGVMGRSSAAPGSLAKGRTRRALRPMRGPASSADPRLAAARRPAVPARAGGAGSSPSRLPSPWRGGLCA